jgi:glycosyltransferase involved in cell wall biosynthesis
MNRALRIGILGDPNDTHVRRWSRGLAASGLSVCNICGDLPATKEPEVGYLQVQRASSGLAAPWHRFRRARRHFGALFRQFDIVHMHNLHNWGIEAGCARSGRFMVSTYGGDVMSFPSRPAESRATREAKVRLLREANRVTATSAFLADETACYGGIDRGAIEVVPFGIDLDRFRPRPRTPTRCGHVGSLKGFREASGAENLIRALALLHRRLPECAISIVGQGSRRARCMEMIHDLGLTGHVVLIDRIPHHRVPDFLSALDVCLFASEAEAFCVAALEAQTLGVPVVATDVGGLRTTVGASSGGVRVEAGNPGALADAACRVLEDHALWHRLSAAGPRFVAEHFRWSDSVRQMINVYEQMLDTAPAARLELATY